MRMNAKAPDEQDFYREIIRRAKRVRERAAESLKRSRETRKRKAGVTRAQADSPASRRRLRRQD